MHRTQNKQKIISILYCCSANVMQPISDMPAAAVDKKHCVDNEF